MWVLRAEKKTLPVHTERCSRSRWFFTFSILYNCSVSKKKKKKIFWCKNVCDGSKPEKDQTYHCLQRRAHDTSCSVPYTVSLSLMQKRRASDAEWLFNDWSKLRGLLQSNKINIYIYILTIASRDELLELHLLHYIHTLCFWWTNKEFHFSGFHFLSVHTNKNT